MSFHGFEILGMLIDKLGYIATLLQFVLNRVGRSGVMIGSS